MNLSRIQKNSRVEGFVTRLYKNVLGREADSAGLEAWEQVLIHHQNTGSDVACGFIFSKEFAEKQTSNEEFVEIMYHTFLDRASDSEGKADWLESLDQGLSREYIALLNRKNSVTFVSSMAYSEDL